MDVTSARQKATEDRVGLCYAFMSVDARVLLRVSVLEIA